jgi:DNA-binding response OmpR family regulator
LCIKLSENTIYYKKQRSVIKDGVEIYLTFKEVLLLDYLSENFGTISTYEQLENAVWSSEGKYMSADAIRSLIYQLRKKIGKNSIKSISKVGYHLVIES